MKTKVYGKRARPPLGEAFEVFTQKSPKVLSLPDKQDEQNKTNTPVDSPPESPKRLAEVDNRTQREKSQVSRKIPLKPLRDLEDSIKEHEPQRKVVAKDRQSESLTGLVKMENLVQHVKKKALRQRPLNLVEHTRQLVEKARRDNVEAEETPGIAHTAGAFVDLQTCRLKRRARNQLAAATESGVRVDRNDKESLTRQNPDGLAQLLQQKLLIVDSNQEEIKQSGSSKTSGPNLFPSFHKCSAALDVDTVSYIAPLLACKNVSPLVENFQAWTTERMSLLSMQKIGEGSFGEVYRATSNTETVIMKVVPLNARKGPGSRKYTSIQSAANEIQLLEKMQKIPGFVEFRGACVLYGSMPSQLIKEWNLYKAQGRTVESKDPNKKTAYSERQLWLLIEMSDAGTNLESGYYRPPGISDCMLQDKYLSVQRTWDIFWQIVRALAKAEVYAEFEHRDLHLGNICAKDNRDEPDMEDLTLVPSNNATPLRLNRTGIEVTIIDYSLSRALTDRGRILYYDFQNNKDILLGEGDLQYDVYRYMAAVLEEDTCQGYVPKTNVLWLSYLLEKLLKVTIELSVKAKSQTDGSVTVAARMYGILHDLQASLQLSKRDEWGLGSSGEVLDLGIRSNWFESEEIINQ